MRGWWDIRRNKDVRLLLVLLIGLIAETAAGENLTAVQWLDKMNLAMKTLNYQGTVIFMKNGQIETMKYRHSIDKGVEQERLSSLNSPMREVTRKSNEVTCVFKETSEKVINHHPLDSSFIINMPSSAAALQKSYNLELAGQESVAMLPAQVVAAQPKDQLRYPRKIWINTQTFLPLKIEIYGLDGHALEQVMFTELNMQAGAEPSNGNDVNDKFHTKHIHSAQAEPLDNATFVLKNWPQGFEPVFFIRNSIQQSQKAVDHLLVSDGFSTVSVYMEAKEADGINGLNSLGSVNSFSKVIDNTQITVLGEVPAETVELIADVIAFLQ